MGVPVAAGIARDDGHVRLRLRVFTGGEGALRPYAIARAEGAPQGIDDELDTREVLAPLRPHGEDGPVDQLQPRAGAEDAGLDGAVVLGAAPAVLAGGHRFGHGVPHRTMDAPRPHRPHGASHRVQW